MAKLDSAHRPEEIWKAALGFLLLELSADRAVILDEGRVVAEGETRTLLEDLELLDRHGLEPPAAVRYAR